MGCGVLNFRQDLWREVEMHEIFTSVADGFARRRNPTLVQLVLGLDNRIESSLGHMPRTHSNICFIAHCIVYQRTTNRHATLLVGRFHVNNYSNAAVGTNAHNSCVRNALAQCSFSPCLLRISFHFSKQIVRGWHMLQKMKWSLTSCWARLELDWIL